MSFPCAYYWYGNKKSKPGHLPKWVEKFMSQPELKCTRNDEIGVKKKFDKPKSAPRTTSQPSQDAI